MWLKNLIASGKLETEIFCALLSSMQRGVGIAKLLLRRRAACGPWPSPALPRGCPNGHPQDRGSRWTMAS